MEPDTKEFVAILAIMGVLDFLYLGVLRKDYIARKIAEMNGKPNIHHPILSFLIAYGLMAMGLYYFVMKRRRLRTTGEVVAEAAFLGMLVYGVFDMSMLNLVEKWTVMDAVQDMAWGTFMFALTAYLTILITG